MNCFTFARRWEQARLPKPACQCKRWTTRRFDPWVGKSPWGRKRHPTPAFLPAESQGQSSLESYSPQGCKSQTRLKQLSRRAHLGARNGLKSEWKAGRAEADLTRDPVHLHNLHSPSTHSVKPIEEKRKCSKSLQTRCAPAFATEIRARVSTRTASCHPRSRHARCCDDFCGEAGNALFS